MVLFLAVQVLSVVLALGPRVVISTSEAITIQLSNVVQCEPVSFILTGQPHATPTWLTLVPFSSAPVFIPITNTSSTLNSVNVTFVPFAAGTDFIASLDDANHSSVAEVSDIVRVLPSPSRDVSCLVKSDGRAGSDYVLNTNTVSQCENFTLQYNRTAIFQTPTVRLFNPEGPSLLLKSTSDDTATGVATYLLSFVRNKEVVLVFDDGAGHNASSAIMTAEMSQAPWIA
ncbi:hypothetical protein C0993_005430 [Termitomyces sp. T159_Od127]|nr:hypothetical protein C0993_005430 [Termitomyces sp. T159_Od127]